MANPHLEVIRNALHAYGNAPALMHLAELEAEMIAHETTVIGRSRTKTARVAVRAMIDFLTDGENEDLQVNGLDRGNRERLVREVTQALNASPVTTKQLVGDVRTGLRELHARIDAERHTLDLVCDRWDEFESEVR